MRVLTITLGVVLSILTAHASLAADRVTLRLALLPIIDTLPVYIAQSKGYFDEYGIEVNILPVGSAVERDQLMQAGRADAMINEISGAALFNRAKQGENRCHCPLAAR
jgi:NitT/TauT family transport system substrate-binding protein